MDPRQLIRSGIAASALAHLSILAVIMVFAEVHPFGSVTAEPITVDIVSPEEAPPAPKTEEPPPPPEVKPEPSDAFDLSAKSVPTPAPAPAPTARQQAAAKQQAAARQQAEAKQQAAAKAQAAAKPPAAEPPTQQQAALSTPVPDIAPPPPAPAAGFSPPEPDISIKYHVTLGLPPTLPVTAPAARSGDDFDSAASKAADVASNIVAEFRRHVRTCSKLPDTVAVSDKLSIKLRVLMSPDGKLLSDPILIEASASTKGVALMQSAISALRACQPYAMLPVDRYNEWKVLDLSFSPQDLDGAS